jgi:hypothetical protein
MKAAVNRTQSRRFATFVSHTPSRQRFGVRWLQHRFQFRFQVTSVNAGGFALMILAANCQ